MIKSSIIDIKENLLPTIFQFYQFDEASVKELGGFHNYVLSAFKDNQEWIIRITERSHRSYNEINSEVMFLNYLNQNQFPTYTVNSLKKFKTKNNTYYVTILSKIQGLIWRDYQQDAYTFFHAGKLLGKLHQISKSYRNPKLKRNHFKKNNYFQEASGILDKTLTKKLNAFLKEVDMIEKNDEQYGLVHGDYNFANIIYNEHNLLSIIDFDECEYNYFVYDIAVYLFYYLLGSNPRQMDIKPNIELFHHFIKGYLEENNISVEMIEKLPLFLRLREYKLLISLLKSAKYEPSSLWAKSYIKTSTKRILEDQPFTTIDYVMIFKQLKE